MSAALMRGQTNPPPNAMSPPSTGDSETGMVAVTVPSAPIRVTVPSPLFWTQTESPPMARKRGPLPALMVAMTDPSFGSIRSTSSESGTVTQTDPRPARTPAPKTGSG